MCHFQYNYRLTIRRRKNCRLCFGYTEEYLFISFLHVFVSYLSRTFKCSFKGWITGHGGHTSYGPDYFLEHDIVLVTGNYRLGPLGFLSTEDENASGNFGFKDQLMMLEWIQMNIEKFGGDGRSVTILGESAGMLIAQKIPTSVDYNKN